MHPSQYGETEVLEMKIDLDPGAIPYNSRVRSLNPDLREQIDEWWSKELLNEGPWASPLIPLKKKDGWTRWSQI